MEALLLEMHAHWRAKHALREKMESVGRLKDAYCGKMEARWRFLEGDRRFVDTIRHFMDTVDKKMEPDGSPMELFGV